MPAEKTTTSRRPAYKLFQIEERGESKPFYREVGVAWGPNKDGSLNLDFAVIPMIGKHTIQARLFVEKDEADKEAPAASQKGRKTKG